jgi:two-component system, NarL family, response regulator DesR
MTGDTTGDTTGDRVSEQAPPIRLVLAEDQAMVLGAFAQLLGLEPDLDVVATATDGAGALAAVRTHDPDVLVTDIEMPGLSGLDVAAELRRERARTRTMIVTTFARSGYLRRALDSGVSGYVLKDAPIDQLVDTVRRVHAGERVVDPALAVAAWGGSDPVTDRERDVLRLAADGLPNSEIAARLYLAEGTVRNYLSTAITKLGVRNRIEAARVARDRGWL